MISGWGLVPIYKLQYDQSVSNEKKHTVTGLCISKASCFNQFNNKKKGQHQEQIAKN